MIHQTLYVTQQVTYSNTSWRTGSYNIVFFLFLSEMGCTAFLLNSTLNTLSFHSNTHTLTIDWLYPQYPCTVSLPHHLLPHAHSPLLPESFANLSSRPHSGWQGHQIPLITKIIEGRFEQAVKDRPRANANSDLLSVHYDVRSGTRSAVHASSLHGCLIRSLIPIATKVWKLMNREQGRKNRRLWVTQMVGDWCREEWVGAAQPKRELMDGLIFEVNLIYFFATLSYIVSEHWKRKKNDWMRQHYLIRDPNNTEYSI